jgi:hypothetical protein
MAAQALVSDDFVTATLDVDAKLMHYARTSAPFPSVDAMRAHHTRMIEVMTAHEPEKLGLLVDVRAAPPRNDDAFESELTRAVWPLLDRFKAYAFLVKTAVGTLQIRRLSTSSGIPTGNVFSDHAAAVAYLASR